MQFSHLTLFTLLSLTAAAPAVTPITSDKLTANIRYLTSLTADLSITTSKLNSGGLLGILTSSNFDNVMAGIQQITSAVNADTKAIGTETLTAYKEKDQAPVCKALDDYFRASQTLLNVIISKSNILQSLTTKNFARVLAQLENAVDQFIPRVLTGVPTCKLENKTKLAALDGKLERAICAYTPLGGVPIIGSGKCSTIL